MDRSSPSPPEVYFVVVGGGIPGLAAGRELLYRLSDARLTLARLIADLIA